MIVIMIDGASVAVRSRLIFVSIVTIHWLAEFELTFYRAIFDNYIELSKRKVICAIISLLKIF